MFGLPVIALVFTFHAAAYAGSTGTVNAADQSQPQQQRPITLYGHTAVIKGLPAAPYKVEKSTPPAITRTEERTDSNPGIKQEESAPVKKKLKPVRFKQEVRRGAPFSCRDALGKVLQIISPASMRPQPRKTIIIRKMNVKPVNKQ